MHSDSTSRDQSSHRLDVVTLTTVTTPSFLGIVLNRYAVNFLLNELSADELRTLTYTPREVDGVVVPGHAPMRRDSAVERLHHARVSLRRMRSILKTYGYLFSPEWSRPLIRELSWYAGVLGTVRDLEVMRGAITRAMGEETNTYAAKRVLGHVDRAIAAARESVLRERASDRCQELFKAVSLLTVEIRCSQDAAASPDHALERGLCSTWRDVNRARRRAERDLTAQRLHRLRIELKRLQYATEVASAVDGELVHQVSLGAEHLQTKLGRVHDGVVARRWLRGLQDDDVAVATMVSQLRKRHRRDVNQTLKGWRVDITFLARQWRRAERQVHGC